jgi:aspartate aminotransferase
MTGWRIGYALGPEEMISRMVSLQGHITSDAASISQWASVGALKEADRDVERMKDQFNQRRELVLDLLARMSYIDFIEPEGAFYVFIDIRPCLGKTHWQAVLEDDISFCSALLKSKNVATVPGSAFMAPGFARISYANSREDIINGMEKLSEFLEELS